MGVRALVSGHQDRGLLRDTSSGVRGPPSDGVLGDIIRCQYLVSERHRAFQSCPRGAK